MISKYGVILLAACLYTAGAAPQSCTCARNLQPMCGTDGVTYSNACMLGCANAQLMHAGECGNAGPAQPPCICSRDNKPVCGSDGTTYMNVCELNCATAQDSTLRVAHQGNCPLPTVSPSCICTMDYTPVCGTDGKTYSNACALNCATAQDSTLRIARQGSCSTVPDNSHSPNCICTLDYKPVCGTDRKTYGNPCALNCAAAQDPSLRMLREGPCVTVKVVPVPYNE